MIHPTKSCHGIFGHQLFLSVVSMFGSFSICLHSGKYGVLMYYATAPIIYESGVRGIHWGIEIHFYFLYHLRSSNQSQYRNLKMGTLWSVITLFLHGWEWCIKYYKHRIPHPHEVYNRLDNIRKCRKEQMLIGTFICSPCVISLLSE